MLNMIDQAVLDYQEACDRLMEVRTLAERCHAMDYSIEKVKQTLEADMADYMDALLEAEEEVERTHAVVVELLGGKGYERKCC